MKKWWQNEIVYQIYPRSFKDSNSDGYGDINGIISKLDYIKNLGVTMIWLTPVYKSPMADNGYDISDYYYINEEFGTMEDFDKLIDECNIRDIKIMMDMVLNHTSDEHPWFKEALKDPTSKYHDYYIFKASKEVPNNWRVQFGGSAWEKVDGRDEYYLHTYHIKQPDLNWENPKLREEIYKMIQWWIDKGIKAFRLDAINHIKKNPSYASIEPDGYDGLAAIKKMGRNQEGLGEFLTELNERVFKPNNCMTVAETAGLTNEMYKDFIGKDGYFSLVFDFRHTALELESGSEWYSRKEWELKDLNDTLMETQTNIQKYGWSGIYFENHDQPRSTSKYLGNYDENEDAIKMLGAYFFFMHGVPFIYQGQELGMKNFVRKSIEDFDDIDSINQYHRAINEGYSEEEALFIVNSRSRDNARVPFAWDDSSYVGFSDVNPWLMPLDDNSKHNAKSEEKENSILNFYRSMIDFRKNSDISEILIYGKLEPVETKTKDVFAYRRKLDSKSVLCIFNFNDKDVNVEINKGEILFSNYHMEQAQEGTLKPFQMNILDENN